MLKPLTVSAALAGLLFLSACDNSPAAPDVKGACYQVATKKDGEVKFNKVADAQPNIEACIARPEEMRVKFLRMGGNRRQITGAYQGNVTRGLDGNDLSRDDAVTLISNHVERALGPEITRLMRVEIG